MTERGIALWPALYALTRWGEAQSARGPRRIFAHVACGTDLDRHRPLPDLRGRPAARRPADAPRPRVQPPTPGTTRSRRPCATRTGCSNRCCPATAAPARHDSGATSAPDVARRARRPTPARD